jgi:hypothetical protein
MMADSSSENIPAPSMLVRRMREEMRRKTHRWAMILDAGAVLQSRVAASLAGGIQRQLSECIPVDHYLATKIESGKAESLSFPLCNFVLLANLDSDAAVALFPTCHSYENERAFVQAVSHAFGVVQSKLCCNSVIVLGRPANEVKEDGGWIEPKPSILGCSGGVVRPVLRFWEKPSMYMARDLAYRGCLRSTSVMIGRVDAFLKLIGDAATVNPAADFSTHLLTVSAERMFVMPIGEIACVASS